MKVKFKRVKVLVEQVILMNNLHKIKIILNIKILMMFLMRIKL